ncbi:zinc ribbon domain-containing protein [Parerythrobacter aestuarii]|uniref:zinc ribbon domain-containing protein n=1 Tax=Parerythrobacter aestuarii TaxID=3020909 RepID=UPI0024DE3989|nr:zinc ribbon domain-containing protein [Parerythrobacter aestuarii]
MANFCAQCGDKLQPGAKFCAGCGTPIDGVANPIPNPDRPATNPAAATEPASSHTPVIIILIVAAAVLVSAAAWWMFAAGASEDDAEAADEEIAEVATEEDPDADRPQEWFDNYTDTFLSADLTRLTSGEARKRSFPTAKGGEILETLDMGRAVTGRWVEGADPETRWLKTNDGGYIWEGNLASMETITTAGMQGMLAEQGLPLLRSSLNPAPLYGSQMDDWESDVCDIYRSRNGLVDVMVEDGKATSFTTESSKLKTARGIAVGASEAELKKAYGAKLKSEQNPYDGTDYFVWDSANRGIKFHVTSDGKIDFISSGTKSIQYVEGCL